MMKSMAGILDRTSSDLISLQKATDVTASIPFYRSLHLGLKGADVKGYDAVEDMGGGEWLYPVERGTPHEELQRPLEDRRMIFYIHGGAFVLCNPATHRGITVNLVNVTNTSLLVASYSRPPKSKFGDEDSPLAGVLKSYLKLIDKVMPSRILVAGESAGGNLAAALCLRLLQLKKPLPGGLVMISPWVDLTEASFEKHSWKVNDDYLPVGLARKFARAYVPDVVGEEISATNCLASPLQAEMGVLSSFPQTLLLYGSEEALADQDAEFATRLESAGVHVRVCVGNGMAHAYPVLYDLGHGGVAKKCVLATRFIGLALFMSMLFSALACIHVQRHGIGCWIQFVFVSLAVLALMLARRWFIHPEKLNKLDQVARMVKPQKTSSSSVETSKRLQHQDDIPKEVPPTKQAFDEISSFAAGLWGQDADFNEYVAGLARNYTYDFPMCPSLATLNNDRPVLKMPFLFLHAPLEKSKSQCSMG
eukprot:CAMPEP_0197700804 /NCGR_PEP_ID=MMETSP1338-20131121/122423_1 /TAXON_ID=43686 ORGANISM="Pelagodinium beii, Strain RCC1491" /NCGR_SAMPLE_ID=MMETSP1338 /ASSEMBLY_ACC=CAM_ASM_000754 /LENGTH=477 /DNA_ID=CAMNT_0043284447 /DNA_START=161 /DNA_END=1592 /DNA_ORIENTATION=+